MMRWGEKRYYSLNYYLKQHYGEKLYKIALDGGMTCPTRDGSAGTRGCIFCSASGSGDFAGDRRLSVRRQIASEKENIRTRYHANAFIAYFQAYTNTYAPVDYLKAIFTEAISDPEVKILSIATRPDCLGPDVLALLGRLNRIKPVWVELGLQTIHEDTARFIRRGYELPVFDRAVRSLREIGIEVIVHTILYLPGEDEKRMLETLDYLNSCDIQGIKLQLLHVIEGTDLAALYAKHPFFLPSMQEYIAFIGTCLVNLRPDMVIHRLTGEAPSELLIAPEWTRQKRNTLNGIDHYLKKQDLWQGKAWNGNERSDSLV